MIVTQLLRYSSHMDIVAEHADQITSHSIKRHAQFAARALDYPYTLAVCADARDQQAVVGSTHQTQAIRQFA